MELEMILKIVCMVGFFCEVVICGKIISKLSFFENKNILSLALSFSGGLFLSIALIHILPDAQHSFNQYFKPVLNSKNLTSSLKHQPIIPLACVICCFVYLLIFFIDKVAAKGSHDHEYELSFVNEPKKKQQNLQYWEQSPVSSNRNYRSTQIEAVKLQSQIIQKPATSPFVLQIGMSIHAFFQCLAVGLQNNPGAIVSLATAIFVHKWAEGLTLGLIYRRNGYKSSTITIMILFQGLINILGLVTGILLQSCGELIIGIFLSVSAGTFLYISTVQVLPQQLKNSTKSKVFSVFLSNLFIGSLYFIQKI